MSDTPETLTSTATLALPPLRGEPGATSDENPEQIGRNTPRRPKGMRARPTECLNCGKKPLYANFCPDCGQENLNYAIPLSLLIQDVMEEFWRWDGKLLRTLALLLFRPGKLTNEFNAGRRVRYVSPFKLYLGVTTLFFLILFVPGIWKNLQRDLTEEITAKAATKTVGNTKAKSKKAEADEEKLEAGFNIGVSDEFDDKHNYRGMKIFDDEYVFGPPPRDSKGNLIGPPLRRGYLSAEYEKWHKSERNDNKWFGPKHVITRQILKGIDNPDRYIQELISGAVKSMFFLMPFYALIASLLFRGAKKYYVEHLVFAINHHTFVFALATLIYLARGLFRTGDAPDLIVIGLVLTYPVYEFIALRAVYKQGKRLTLFKQFVLNQVYYFIVTIGVAITALITLALL